MKNWTPVNTTDLLDLEPDRPMQQRFMFSKGYAGRIHLKRERKTGKIWASSLLVSLKAMNNHENDGVNHTPIRNDQDAIDRVAYTLNHEWLHYAFRKVNHQNNIEQERMIYASIGNGGNQFLNKHYRIALNPVVEELTND